MISQLCVVDFNAEILRKLATSGIAGFLGDVSRVDTLIRAGVPHAQVVVSTIPQMLLKGTDGEQLIRTVRQLAPQASIIASADFKNQVKELEKAGADRVLLPYSIAGEECAGIVLGMMGKLLPDGSVKAPGGGENH
jgi:voltage-gated potassium channel